MWKPFALILLAACSVPTADAKDWPQSTTATPYGCDGLVAARQIATVDPALIQPWHELATAAKFDERWGDRVMALATIWKTWKPERVTVEGRVRIQHEMLQVAQVLDGLRRHGESNRWEYARVHRRVMAQIRAIAPSSAELAELGDGSRPAVHSILGGPLAVTQRATESCGSGNSIHVARHEGLLAFRPLRTDTTRALVSQIVAFDSDGKPHITPLVAGMELRLGNEVTSPACLVQAEPDGTLAVQSFGSFEEHAPFVQRREQGLGCKSCHYSANTMNARDLTAAETVTIDKARTGQVDRLATELWKTLADPLRQSATR